ncbi:MAG: FemAB family PEP-CTERM system-associated protein [Sedimentisphaerales bacterium]|nr:FemAB family PEP-CTERM system-associated protein [Sedimentisphaerales bacterium]
MAQEPDKINTNGLVVDIAHQPPDWWNYLKNHSQATIYHHPAWGQVMRDAYRNLPCYLTVRRGNEICGVLQLVEQRSKLFGAHLCSLPYFDAVGILADDDESIRALAQAAANLMRDRNVQWVELRHLQPICTDLPARTDKVTIYLDLPENTDVLWEGFTTKLRTKIRKARKSDVTTHQGGMELLEDYYLIYLLTMRELGSPPHSRKFFHSIVEAFSDQVRLFVVRMASQPVAASFTLIGSNMFHVPWSGSRFELRKLNVNLVLYWDMLEYACGRGLKIFDFGRSTLDSGTYIFKKQWGARDVSLYWQFLLADDREMPQLSPDSPRYRRFVACWKKLPLPVTRWLGPKLISKLS